MGAKNHSVSIVAKSLPAEVRGQIELDLTEGSKSQADILSEYAGRYPEEFAKFSDRAFYRWMQGILNEWDRQRRELARERLRATYAIRNSELAQASLADCDEAAQRKFHELLAGIAANPETDNHTLKQMVAVVDSIGTLGKLGVAREKLQIERQRNEREQEAHDARMSLQQKMDEVKSGTKDPQQAMTEMLETFDRMFGIGDGKK
ncbi:MAG TPA: hypothetical protein PK458_20400 [Phycisphaerae bacterium]|nr:hypothetical protein [Phycisphaerae bacterium]